MCQFLKSNYTCLAKDLPIPSVAPVTTKMNQYCLFLKKSRYTTIVIQFVCLFFYNTCPWPAVLSHLHSMTEPLTQEQHVYKMTHIMYTFSNEYNQSYPTNQFHSTVQHCVSNNLKYLMLKMVRILQQQVNVFYLYSDF